MSVQLYMDVHVRRSITVGLRLRGVDVVTAQEDQADQLDDAALLDRATHLGRILFSQDEDLLREAGLRHSQGTHFAGLVYAHQMATTIGQAIRDLELIAKVYEPEDMTDRIEYLPL